MKNNKMYLPVWIRLLPMLENYNISTASIKLGVTFAHSLGVVQELSEKKLIEYKKIGRNNVVTLTPKGIIVSRACKILLQQEVKNVKTK